MQGRLSQPTSGRLQAFPWKTWQLEFVRARSIGFQCIEWLFDGENFENNPIWTEVGRRQIRRSSAENGIQVLSVCAHYFVRGGLVSADQSTQAESVTVLRTLVQCCASLGVERIVLPFMENASIQPEFERSLAFKYLQECLPVAEKNGVQLVIETDLPAQEFAGFLQCLEHTLVRVCYDLGNAVAMGYDVTEDVKLLIPWLAEVHVKDRFFQGKSVPLGQGNVDFPIFFQRMVELEYAGPLVLETPTCDNWQAMARQNLQFVSVHLSRAREGIKQCKR